MYVIKRPKNVYLKSDACVVVRVLGDRLETIQKDDMRPIVSKDVTPRMHDA
jgi:hypothetical protein